MSQDDRRFEKGFFTRVRFAVATRYPELASRRNLFIYGIAAGVVVAVLFGVDALVGRAVIVVGPLSESHALFARDCSTCHTPLHGARNASCESCHQRGSEGNRLYSLSRHYEYRSGDVDRTAPKSKEATCSECHREHRGRTASLSAVADGKCTSCHTTGSFNRSHPEFQFITENIPDPANLLFTHVRHVREVMDDQKLTDAQQACAHCHIPKADGKNFEPLSYVRSCDGCHLTSSGRTPYIPLRGGGRPGVATLADIRRSGGPGTQWADYWNSGEFTEGGGSIRKSPVFHADPWVMHNLRRLRQEMYPTAELADLLRTSAEMPADQSRALYEEAIRTLEGQVASLRGNPSPDVQAEVESLNEILKLVRTRIDQPFAALDESQFAVTDADRAVGLDERAYQGVIDSLTKPCQECHLVERATIRRVQADQRSLVRAEFDHKKHVIHAKCLDCHSGIPVRELVEEGKAPADRDNAAIQNIPGIKSCQSCHTGSKAPNRCTSCHLFHPDKSHWANLSK